MNTKIWFEIIAKCGQPEKNTDCVIAKCEIKSKGLSPCFWKPQFAVLPCGSVFLAGERNGKWREGRVTLKIRVEVKEAFGIESLWFGLWRKIEGSRNRDSSVFAGKWNEFIFRKCFVSVFVAYELIFCAFVPVLSTVYSIVSLLGVESRLVNIPFQRWWGKQKGKR